MSPSQWQPAHWQPSHMATSILIFRELWVWLKNRSRDGLACVRGSPRVLSSDPRRSAPGRAAPAVPRSADARPRPLASRFRLLWCDAAHRGRMPPRGSPRWVRPDDRPPCVGESSGTHLTRRPSLEKLNALLSPAVVLSPARSPELSPRSRCAVHDGHVQRPDR